MTPAEQAAIAYLQTPQAIRDRAQQLFERCQADQLDHFACDLDRLDEVAAYVVSTTQAFYPDFDIPFHSRWRHFDVGGVPRLAALNQRLSQALDAQSARPEVSTPFQVARSQVDLAVVSVLLDAGAGTQWRYQDLSIGPGGDKAKPLQRSEGLAVASLRAFEQGLFSSDPAAPYQVDAVGLQKLTEADLAGAFQVSSDNPLVGLSGRLDLLQKLGETLEEQSSRSSSGSARPSNLLDRWMVDRAPKGKQNIEEISLDAGELLSAVLKSFGAIWPGRAAIAQTNLGDVWPHPQLVKTSIGGNLVPFHKLSQWLTYSLVEPLAAAGIAVTNLNALTGLAEYRNGGLCLDMGLLVPKHPEVTSKSHLPSSPVVVEWRALTIVLLDLIGDRVQQLLDKSPEELPLIKILEGGTWAAGRRIAKQLRPTGAPPITIQSDGTVF
ncbi:URC4/urg3 family protein [cf. Phormidesmis sp. LEGE 11477]|uniref:URC4/urg3 family protein n=1 Tax=cf. Phormidesmis sp. LEGE 11477 TaxID=1828680 RepID=UPI001882E9CD|nr:URC4/urg3 family protein [cf. Phormidesmis sp. LEGE 11477]MBE9062631.1 URC4/urg3 family protein [cf. Phormidesmis sp. LEGE 11477]